MGHMTWPHPFQGQFVVCRLGLAMINLHTLCSPTMKIWKATQNVKIGVVWRLGATQGYWQCHHLIGHIWLPIRF